MTVRVKLDGRVGSARRGRGGETWRPPAVKWSTQPCARASSPGLAATRITAAELDALADLIEAMEPVLSADDENAAAELARLNAEFHRIVVSASGSSQLVTLTSSVARGPLMNAAFRRDGSQVAMRSHILGARNAVSEGSTQP